MSSRPDLPGTLSASLGCEPCVAYLGRLDALLLVGVLEFAQLPVADVGGDAPVVLLLVVPRRLLELQAGGGRGKGLGGSGRANGLSAQGRWEGEEAQGQWKDEEAVEGRRSRGGLRGSGWPKGQGQGQGQAAP